MEKQLDSLYHCDICGFTANSKKKIFRHQASYHGPKSECKLPCVKCGYMAKNPRALKIHLRRKCCAKTEMKLEGM